MSAALSISANESFFAKQNSEVYEDQKKKGRKKKGQILCIPPVRI